MLFYLRLPYFCLSTEIHTYALCSCKRSPHLREAADLRHTHNSPGPPAALPTGLPADTQFPNATSEQRSDEEEGYFGLSNALKPNTNERLCMQKKPFVFNYNSCCDWARIVIMPKPPTFCPEAPFNHVPRKARKLGL